jgi:RimJ/RimL family protein N-acetyltransferase
MAYEDLYVFTVEEEAFAFHTKTAFLVQLDAPTARFLSLRGDVSAFLEEYPGQVLDECTAALSGLYEDDLLPKELEIEERKNPKSPRWVLDLASIQDPFFVLGATLKATAALSPTQSAPLVVGLSAKERIAPCPSKSPGVVFGVHELEGVFRHPSGSNPMDAVLCLETFEPAIIQRLFREGTGRVWLDWGGWIPSPPEGLFDALVSLMGSVWEENPKAILEPLSSWIRAMYEAVPPIYPPWIGVLLPGQDESLSLKASPRTPEPTFVSLQDVLALLGESDTCKPVCRDCPILKLCQGGHWAARLKNAQAGHQIAPPDPRECAIAFDVFRAAVALYDRLEREGLLETQAGDAPTKEMERFAWGTHALSARLITEEFLVEVGPFLKKAFDDGLLLFERFLDPSWREVRRLLQEDEPKRRLVALKSEEGEPCGFLWVAALEQEHRADASLWFSEYAYGLLTPFALKDFLRTLLGELGIRKLSLYILPGHARLEKLLESAGAVLEGVLREAAFLEGGFLDVAVYACLDEKLQQSSVDSALQERRAEVCR